MRSIPRSRILGLAEAVDVFCEEGVFDLEQTRRMLSLTPTVSVGGSTSTPTS